MPHVVNYDLPNVAADYVHRIGRTGRAGSRGEAISLVSGDERGALRDIERLIKQTIPQHVVAGFEPDFSTATKTTSARRPQRTETSHARPAGRHHAPRNGTQARGRGGKPSGTRRASQGSNRA